MQSNDQSDPFSSINPVLSLKLNDPLAPQKPKSLPQTITNSKTTSNLIDLRSLDENSNSFSSSSSSSLSSISNINDFYIADKYKSSYTCHHHHHTKIKFFNRPKPQPNKCICKNEKLYNCYHCTSNYPISVRRSKDGEETNYVVNNTNENKCLDDIKSESSFTSCDSIQQTQPKINLKPSPIPISPHLIALLTLTNPANKFIPPPNKNLAAIKQNK